MDRSIVAAGSQVTCDRGGESDAAGQRACCCAGCLGDVLAAEASRPPSGVRSLEVVSNRADLISGGDALVAATLADGADPRRARGRRRHRRHERVRACGRTAASRALVTGLKVGANTLTVRAADGAGKRITITNHPIGGPVFAGPQVTPYACNPNASNPPLGPALDAQCNAPTRVELLYRNAADQFVAYDPANPPAGDPDDDHGRRPDRAVHRRARHRHRRPRHLPDGGAGRPGKPVAPWSAEQPWSRKLFYTFGGACGTEHRQLAPGNVLQAAPLGARLRRRHLEPEHLRQQLQRRRLGRGGDDDQGARRSSATARCATRWATAARRPRCSSTCWPRTTPGCSTG